MVAGRRRRTHSHAAKRSLNIEVREANAAERANPPRLINCTGPVDYTVAAVSICRECRGGFVPGSR